MHELYQQLFELQDLDQEIARAEARLAGFGPQLEVLEAPATGLEREFEAARARLAQMRQDLRRLERAAEEKRDRLRRHQERLDRVRNPREEAAARTEMDLIRKATEADEAEALHFMDQTTRGELKLDELERRVGQARAEVEPRRLELLAARAAAEGELAVLQDRRGNFVLRVDPSALRLYERVRGGRTRLVIAPLMPDGACGHCFNIVPIQQQVEIQQGRNLIRCEACGVILAPGE